MGAVPFRTIVSRQCLDLAAVRPEQIDLRDIVRGLSNCCRFACQVHEFYSVAQHSLLVATLVPPDLAKHARLHDASEAYLGDLSHFLKHHPALLGYRRFEEHLTAVINKAFDLRPLTLDETLRLKAADDLAAVFEQWVLRERRAWLPAKAILWACGEGFTRGDAEAMLNISHLLPRGVWRGWCPSVAEAMFFRAHHLQQRTPLNVWELTDE